MRIMKRVKELKDELAEIENPEGPETDPESDIDTG